MFLSQWFTRRAQHLETAPANFPNLSPPDILAAADRDDDTPPSPASGRINLDPAYLAMEYMDASGRITSRSITLLSLNLENAAPAITAQCHLRKAVRTFRIDRIRAFIDENGEVLQPDEFLASLSGCPIAMLRIADSRPPQPAVQNLPLAILRTDLRDRVNLLVLAAKSDSNFHPKELDAIIGFVENEIARMDGAASFTFDVTSEFLNAFPDLVRRLRPRPTSVDTFMAGILKLDASAQRRFWSAIKSVFDADAILHADEVDFWQELQRLAGSD